MKKEFVSKYRTRVREDLTGQKFGHLTVIEEDTTKPTGHGRFWKCSCECGGTKSVRGSHLKTGFVKSCGCLATTLGPKNGMWKGYKDIGAKFWYGIKYNAKIRATTKDLPFEITIEDIWEQYLKQDKKCPYTGKELTFLECNEFSGKSNLSLDRIDSKKGYTKDNIHWIYRPINRFKNNF